MYQTKRRQNIISPVIWNAVLIMALILIQGNVFGQYQKAPTRLSIFLSKNWSVNLNGGKTSFFGEVSLYDDDLTEKLSKEGGWAYGIIISKKISPLFTFNGQVLKGQLKGSNTRSNFCADITEYSFSTSFNIVNLLLPDNDAHLFFYGKIGMGQFEFTSTLSFNDAEKQDIIVKSKTPEFFYLLGGGTFYRISSSFDANVEMAARLADNDKLDGTSNKKDKDYYAYLSIGLTYKINNRPRDTRYYRKMGMKSPLIRRR